jgi:hypothetical protein
MENLKCIFSSNYKNHIPEFDLNFLYENEFFNDEYILETDLKSNIFKKIKYNIYKNGNFIGNIFLESYNIENLLEDFNKMINDYDVERLYKKNIKETLLENYSIFIKEFENKVLKNPNNLIGEIYKMRKAAGI